jgi:hypothetical protein
MKNKEEVQKNESHECKLVYIQTNSIGKCVYSDTYTAQIAEVGGSNLIFKFFFKKKFGSILQKYI